MCLYFQPCHTVKLLTILKLMLDKHGPDVYFNFSGQEGGVSGHVVFFFDERCGVYSFQIWIKTPI